MTENRQLMAKNPRLCTKAYTAFGFSLFLTDFMPFFEEEGHLTSNLFAYVPIPTEIRKDTKDCNLSHQVSPVCAQKQASGMFIAYALYTALTNSCYLRHLDSF